MIKKRRVSIDISIGSIFWVLFALGSVFVLTQLMDVIILLFTSLLIALAICPLVDWLQKYRINRAFSSVVILLSFFGIVVSSAVSLASPLFQQTELLIEKLPGVIDMISPVKFDVSSFNAQFSAVPSQVLNIALGTFSGFVTALTVVVLSFYIIQEMHRLREHFTFWFGEKAARYYAIASKLEAQVGYWVRGEMLLMLSVGLLSYVGYLIVGLPFAITLAFTAGLLELIPNVGPTIATIPAVLVGLTISPTHAVAALIVQLVVQQLENNLLVPKIMQKAINLNPIVTILAIMIGFRLGGPLLAILALPMVLTARVILAHVKLNKDTTIPEIS
jgi:predicted PurR-regulated permease PerM